MAADQCRSWTGCHVLGCNRDEITKTCPNRTLNDSIVYRAIRIAQLFNLTPAKAALDRRLAWAIATSKAATVRRMSGLEKGAGYGLLDRRERVNRAAWAAYWDRTTISDIGVNCSQETTRLMIERLEPRPARTDHQTPPSNPRSKAGDGRSLSFLHQHLTHDPQRKLCCRSEVLNLDLRCELPQGTDQHDHYGGEDQPSAVITPNIFRCRMAEQIKKLTRIADEPDFDAGRKDFEHQAQAQHPSQRIQGRSDIGPDIG